jgi:hypothetical protein
MIFEKLNKIVMKELQYPIGEFKTELFSNKLLQQKILDIQFLPNQIEQEVLNLDEAQLNATYRPQGWMIKQVVHHVADSHINAYCRYKLGLTEENPTIRPYDEVAWAALKDSLELPIELSITLLYALHNRWQHLLKTTSQDDFLRKTVYHPGSNKIFTLWDLLCMYSWHGRHHVAHIALARTKNKW